MAKVLLLAAALAVVGVTAGWAQANAPAADHGGAGARSGNITPTGETVPNPGASQSAGVTPLDQGIKKEDTRIQSSICKGC